MLLIASLLMMINSYTTINRLREKVIERNIMTNVITDKEQINPYYSEEINSLKEEVDSIQEKLNKSADIPTDTDDMQVNDVSIDGTSYDISYNINESSGLSENDFNTVIDKLNLSKNCILFSGLGKSLVSSEKKYNVNGIFILAVAMRMSNNGTSKLACRSNNLFGMLKSDCRTYIKFDSNSKSVEYFSKLMSIYYFNNGYNTIDKVSKKYIPGASDKWKSDIISNIRNIKNIIGG
jgi:beta-N-acetylglucosaminidase